MPVLGMKSAKGPLFNIKIYNYFHFGLHLFLEFLQTKLHEYANMTPKAQRPPQGYWKFGVFTDMVFPPELKLWKSVTKFQLEVAINQRKWIKKFPKSESADAEPSNR